MNEPMTISKPETKASQGLVPEPEISADWVEFFKEARRLARKVEAAAKVSSEHDKASLLEAVFLFTERKVA